jgi:hypothetical protein
MVMRTLHQRALGDQVEGLLLFGVVEIVPGGHGLLLGVWDVG